MGAGRVAKSFNPRCSARKIKKFGGGTHGAVGTPALCQQTIMVRFLNLLFNGWAVAVTSRVVGGVDISLSALGDNELREEAADKFLAELDKNGDGELEQVR